MLRLLVPSRFCLQAKPGRGAKIHCLNGEGHELFSMRNERCRVGFWNGHFPGEFRTVV
jgi:hypothetical protein